ncbi:hypothetical protein NLJ89_g6173 [Agrocybe chaxingu]|uniref:Choice-of-anchor B family protein n=1 Tax=Agrocybe chaxingu TaxID=84603 RepID=A0A9W8K629_9AGAR|nr:hypothetical protein NLJ89_g6173 [Agrocybe chaxingu]
MGRFISVAVLVASLTLPALSTEISNPARKAAYISGAVHNGIMDAKHQFWDEQAASGAFDSARFSAIEDFTPCVDGFAGEFRCNNIDLYSFYTHAELGSTVGQGSSSWGWVHEGREFIIIAQADGAAIAEVTQEGKLDYLGRLPKTPEAANAIWRELRVLDHYLVVGSEAVNHHVQIFDLLKVLDITPEEKPKTFNPATDLTALWTGLPIGRTHNIVINWDLGYIIAVGSQPRTSEFRSGLVFIDISNVTNPTLAGFEASAGYVHDAQCLLYKGPDVRYLGNDICYGYNEDRLVIYNVTDRANARVISQTSYEGAAYTHQGWVLDTEDQRFLILDDELDERNGRRARCRRPRGDLHLGYLRPREPKQTGFYKSVDRTVDHNQYVHEGKAYQSNYGNGLRVLDISSIPSDPTGSGVQEIGFFDIYPEDDNQPSNGSLQFVGTWSSYPYLPSGFIIINTIERGAYVVKLKEVTIQV